MPSPSWPQRLPSPYRPEPAVAAAALERLQDTLDWSTAMALATPWVEAVRRQPAPFWLLESLLQQHPLHSPEGQAMMRLAEALLRVPDTPTATALLADLLQHIAPAPAAVPAPAGKGWARLARRALQLVQQTLPPAHGPTPAAWQQLGAHSLVRLARQTVQTLGHQFVLGQTLPQALREAHRQREHSAGLRFSFDMLGEGARTAAAAQHYLEQYEAALLALAASHGPGASPLTQDGLSIKLSALHPRFEAAQRTRVLDELVPRVWRLCTSAAQARLNLTIDAEESDRLELTLEVFEALLAQVAAEHPQWTGFGLALQAYQTRALDLVDHVIGLARHHGAHLTCRLVKGAYWDSEIKRAQELGLPHYPVFTHKHHTDLSYLACAQALLAAPDAVTPQFATHNAATLAAVLALANPHGRTPAPAFELQRLHGMGQGVYQALQASLAPPVRVYAPVGPHQDLLAYLVRRLLENGANASFVHQLANPDVALDVLLASPLHVAPEPGLPLPPALFGLRLNSQGLDLSVPQEQTGLVATLANTPLPPIPDTPPGALAPAWQRAHAAWPGWRDRPVAERAHILRQAADQMQHQLPQLSALLVREARKTWGDAVAEVREAVDFLRYYASEAEVLLVPRTLPGPTGEHSTWRLRGRGVWVCISPWNFPLAIFTGQVAAALVTGNTVLAKPAEQTPAVAQAAVRLLLAAGVPPDVLQCLPGPGETVGAVLVRLPGVAGVVFTGSTAVAKQIQRALAASDGPIVPLIAETGGINAMLVDATALPEQVCDAVLHSAFGSAGQRCSALRLLCVHEAVADAFIGLLCCALPELRVGDPARFDTDVGPLIDTEAAARVQAQIQALRQRARLLWTDHGTLPPDAVAPHLFELRRLADLQEEVFGPVLCVVRWGSGELPTPASVIEAVNALGYGLTLGLQTRIDSRAQTWAAQAQAGNVYVNRHITGAVVGSQPFGGTGLSGTGPQAGGPLYLPRFCREQTVCVNTAAAGGNAALLAAPQPAGNAK